MALRTEQVRVIGPLSVAELMTSSQLVLPQARTLYNFVPQKKSLVQTGSRKLRFLKNFEEV